jgi:hypothetical protein
MCILSSWLTRSVYPNRGMLQLSNSGSRASLLASSDTLLGDGLSNTKHCWPFLGSSCKLILIRWSGRQEQLAECRTQRLLVPVAETTNRCQWAPKRYQ